MESEQAVQKPSRLRTVKLPLWVSLLLLLMFLTTLGYLALSQREAARRQEAAVQDLTSRFTAEKTAAAAQAQEAFTRQSEAAYRLFGTALAWSVRDALMRKNLDEIDQYFGELVKDERIRLVLLADATGNVIVSTDRNFKGAPFAQHFPAAALEHKSVSIESAEGQMKRLVMPIQGLNERLGTALLVYQAPAPRS